MKNENLSLQEIIEKLPNYDIKKDIFGERIDVIYGGEVYLYKVKKNETILDASLKALNDYMKYNSKNE